MEKFSWTDPVKTEEVLHRIKDKRNTLHKIKTRKVNWIGHILRRNCILNHVIEGRLGGIGRQRKDVSCYGMILRKQGAVDRAVWRRRCRKTDCVMIRVSRRNAC
jgi:hypothetical protein